MSALRAMMQSMKKNGGERTSEDNESRDKVFSVNII